MINNNYTNLIVNCLVSIITILCFYMQYNIKKIIESTDIILFIIIIVAFILINTMKCFRLYLEIYGNNISIKDYISFFIKVTPVSNVIPWKLGDIYRCYCLGNILNNNLKGTIIIVFDRFVDTLGLLTISAFVLLKGEYFRFFYILLIFCVLLGALYYSFPGVSSFWIDYLIREKSSNNTLVLLKFIKKIKIIYEEIRSVVKGRGLVLYIISCIAWLVELLLTYIIVYIYNINEISYFEQYIFSILGFKSLYAMRIYSFYSFLYFILIFITIKFKLMLNKE